MSEQNTTELSQNMQNSIIDELSQPESERVNDSEHIPEIHRCLKNLVRKKKLKKDTKPAIYHIKEWRKNQPWYIDGKRNECEIYQRTQIESITNNQCPKTSERINMETNDIIECSNPMTREDGFYWTEDFDGKQIYTDRDLYYNFKMCIGSGGGQTRTLREVAHFIEYQLKYNLKHKYDIKYFVNILDGDICYKHYQKYFYILNKEKYKHVKNFVYIGDTYGFIDWFDSINVQ